MITWLAAGTYLLQADVVTETRIPVFGWVRMTSRSVSRVTLELQGDDLLARQRVCALQMIGGGPTRTTMPPAFLAALPEEVFTVDLGADGTLFADPGPSFIGQQPDGTVVDFEGDGKPGATVLIDIPMLGRAELYFVQRAHTRLVGVRDGDGAAGRVEVVDLEQRNLGATHRIVASERPGRVVEEETKFVLRRLDDGTDCADVLAASE